MSRYAKIGLCLILTFVLVVFSLSGLAYSEYLDNSIENSSTPDPDSFILLKNAQFSTDIVQEPVLSSVSMSSSASSISYSSSSSSISSQIPDLEEYYLVQFKGPVLEQWKTNVTDTGATLFDYIPNNAFIVRMNSSVKAAVYSLDTVSWIGPFHPSYKIEQSLLSGNYIGNVDLIVVVFDPAENQQTIAELHSIGAMVRNTYSRSLMITIDSGNISDIANIGGVNWVEGQPELTFMNDVAADIMGVTNIQNTLGLNGSGQIVHVIDSGLDSGVNDASMHDDLEGQIISIYDISGDGTSDISGHGTHVTGSVLGTGNLSNGQYKGIAPGAKVVFHATEAKKDSIPYLDTQFMSALQVGYNDGARIHTNSWGTLLNQNPSHAYAGYYSQMSHDIDNFMWTHPESLILFSAGNDGSSAGTVSDQASAKNILTVGSSENYRPLISTASDNPSEIASDSSRGPTDDGRIKPDIVAPGTNIVSTVPTHLNLGYYAYGSGTSMATPLTAGSVALVRQHYNETEGIIPSGALLKATVIHGADDLGHSKNSQGFGRVNISESLNPSESTNWIYYDNTSGFNVGDLWQRSYAVSNLSELKVTLVWTDYPANVGAGTLTNNLNLIVTGPSGAFYGNGAVDSTNTVEQVIISSPARGEYNISINAVNVPNGPQPFSIVFSANFSDTIPPGNITNLTSTLDERWINWTWENPSDPDFLHTEIYLDGVFKQNTVTPYYKATGLIPNTSYLLSTRTVDIYDNINLSWTNNTMSTTPDTTPPLNVSNLSYDAGGRWINFSWTDPSDMDFDYVDVFINGSFMSNVSDSHYYISGLEPSTNHNITVHTVDIYNNTNTSGIILVANTTADITPPLSVTDLNYTSGERWINLTWISPVDVDLDHSDVYLAGSLITNVTNNYYLITGLDPATNYNFNVYSVDVYNNSNTSSSTFAANTTPDTTSPFSVTGLSADAGDHWINLSWFDPENIDFSYVDVYVNDSLTRNVSNNFSLITGLAANTSYNLSTRAVDSFGNTNATIVFVLMNTTTDTTPPMSISGLSASTTSSTIIWSWTNSLDEDYSHVDLYLNDVYHANSSTTSYTSSGLSSSSVYNLSTRSVDTSGNINSTWINFSSTTTTPVAPSSPSGGSSGGGGGMTGEYFENVGHKEVVSDHVLKNSEAKFTFKEDAVFDEFELLTDANVGSVKVIIEVLIDTSTLVESAPDGVVYQNLNMWVGNLGLKKNIVSSSVGFKVEKEWIAENRLDSDMISLQMYRESDWTDVPTIVVNEDGEYIYYESDTGDEILGSFSIVGPKSTFIGSSSSSSSSPSSSGVQGSGASEESMIEGDVNDEQSDGAIAGLINAISNFFKGLFGSD